MADGAFWNNQDNAKVVVQRVKELKGWVEPFDRLDDRITSARELDELLDAEPDTAVAAELDTELRSLTGDIREFEVRSLLRGPDDWRSAQIEIAAGAGGNLDLGAPPVIGPAKERAHLEFADVTGQRPELGVQFRRHRGIGFRVEELVQLASTRYAVIEPVEGLDPALQFLDALDDDLRVVLVVPEGAVGHLFLETSLLVAQTREVKDAS